MNKIKKTRIRIHNPEVRKEQLMKIAIKIAIKKGYQKVTNAAIADKAKVSTSLVIFHFKNIKLLRESIMKYAIANEVFIVIAQGIIIKDPNTTKIDKELRKKAIHSLSL